MLEQLEELFHASTAIPFKNRKKIFTPRIPKCRADGEDSTTKRISFSDTILGCLKAIPDSYDGVSNRVSIQDTDGVPALFAIYRINTNTISKNNILTPEELYREYVPDALYTREYWILNNKLSLPLYSLIRVKDCIPSKVSGETFTSIEYEHSIENYDRTYRYTFIYEKEYDDMKKIILESGCNINNSGSEMVDEDDISFNKIFFIDFTVSANIEMRKIWLRYLYIRQLYQNELDKKDFEILKRYS